MNSLKDGNICPKCKTNSLHYVQNDEITISEENYKDVLPSDLHYAYLQMKNLKMTFSERKLAVYSIKDKALEISNNRWLKSKL